MSTKRVLRGILAGVALCGFSYAQEAAPPPTSNAAAPQRESAQAGGNFRVAPGSIIPVQLTKGIDAKKAKKGDPVEAKVTQDLKSNSGVVVVPKGTKVTGQLTEAQAADKDQKQSQVGIAFDHVVLKDGSEAALPMSIQAVIAPWNSNGGNNDDAAGGNSDSMPAGSGTPGMSSGNRSGGNTGAGPGGAPAAAPPSNTSDLPSAAQSGAAGHQPITANTRGVVGISNLELSGGSDLSQGSLLRSGKGSVKLESGTWMLLRVNPSNP